MCEMWVVEVLGNKKIKAQPEAPSFGGAVTK